MSFVLVAALGPPSHRSSRFAWERFVFTWALLHDLQPPIPPSSGAIPGERAALSLRSSRPAEDCRDRHRQRLCSLRAACLPGPAVFDAETNHKLFPETRHGRGALPDSYILSLSVHVTATKYWQAVPPTGSWPLARPRQACRAPGTRPRSLLSRWLRKRAVAIPLFRCFEFFGATLPFESIRVIAKSLHAALAAAGPRSPRLTLDRRMGTIPAGLNFQHPRPSANPVAVPERGRWPWE
jgi:hypothetical protein